MKIKRFLAPDMRTALQHVRQEHGPDAVILSNRVTPEGVEIVAASQYDEDAVRDAATPAPPPVTVPVPTIAEVAASPHAAESANTGSAPLSPPPVASEETSGIPDATAETPVAAPLMDAPPVAPKSASPTDAPVVTPTPIELPPAAPPSVDAITELAPEFPAPDHVRPEPAMPAATTQADSIESGAPWTRIQDELAQMRHMLDRGLKHMTDEVLGSSRARQQCVEWLHGHGFSADLTRELALTIPADSDPRKTRKAGLALLEERLPLATDNLLDAGGMIALIGPSGAGKTTTIGKLAAHYSARHGVRDIALVSMDNTRHGGSERLYSLARQLGIVVHEADSQDALTALLQRLSDYRLVLIDSAGFSPHDACAAQQLDWLGAADAVRSLLVLPAHTQHPDLNAAIQRFGEAKPEGVILTKLDETSRLGNAFSVLITHQLMLTWFTDGQHLHDDLHWARDADLLARLDALGGVADDAPYDPVEALVAHHAFA